MPRVILDAREYQTALPITGKNTRATEALLKRIAHTLRDDGHQVDVVTAEPEEHHVNGVNWWPSAYYPRKCDVLIAFERLDGIKDFQFERLLVSLNRLDPTLAGNEARVERFVCFSDNHVDVLLQHRPTIKREQCIVIGPGVNMPPHAMVKVLNRLIWCNSPDRGLIHIARLWPRLLELVPTATIAVTYDFDGYLRKVYWLADVVAEHALEIRDWMQRYPESVLNMGELPYERVLEEQQKSQVFLYPSDMARPGTLFHCFAALEAAAAGCVLVVPRMECWPSVFGEVAYFIEELGDYEAWARGIAGLLENQQNLQMLSLKTRTWALPQKWAKGERAWRDLVRGRQVNWTGPGHEQWRKQLLIA